MVQRQFASRQFVPVTDGWAQSEFAFTSEGYMKRVQDTTKSWRKIYLMELALYVDTITVDYDILRQRRVKSQLTPPIGVACQNPFSELEMARREFKREKAKLLRDISSLQEENYQLNIDVQIEKSKNEKVQKEVEATRKDLRDLHLENKKLRGTIKNSGLGKSSTEWKEELSNIKGGMEFWKAKAKKEEERAARTMIELRKKNVKYETMSVKLTARALEEKNGQHDRDIRAYERALQEKDIHLGGLINEIRKAAAWYTTSLESRHSYKMNLRARAMDAELNERMEMIERTQRELQEQLAKSQQEVRDLMIRSREESLEQRDQMANRMEMMTALVK
ncbi:uncharacterized protein LOC105762183 [Gossypium raimondii]|uniref:uncharacterized protein LOC105762183 n=1 Tax=Gossypium raimondii TaxID=29730 RepID=UPI00063AFA10|nr:uncharacterized protein LOC105762183 [Gossypium raimondii]